MRRFPAHLSVAFLTLSVVGSQACGTSSDEDRSDDSGTAVSELCAALDSLAAACSPPSSCESAFASDCPTMSDTWSQGFHQAFQACLEGGGDRPSCFHASAFGLDLSVGQKELAATYCAMCTPDVVDCEASFFLASASGLSGRGAIALPWNETLVQEIKEQCTTGDACAEAFTTCTQRILTDQGVSTASAACLADGLAQSTPPDARCQGAPDGGMGGTGGSGTGGSGGTGTGGSGGTVSTGGTGGSAGTGGTGGTDTGGSGGSGGSGACAQDDAEPNDDQSDAQDIGTLTDCDSDSVITQGTFLDGDDHDWFTAEGQDTATCLSSPNFSFSSSSEMTVCVYFKCNSGETSLECAAGTTASSTAPDEPGCCMTAANGAITPDLNCKWTTDDSAQVWIEAYSDGATDCSHYSIRSAY